MEKNVKYRIKLDEDLQGLSISIIEQFEIDGDIVLKAPRTRAFRKVTIDEEGNEVVNPDFGKQVDEWTGEKDFVKKKLNF